LEIKKICWVQVKNDWVQGAFAEEICHETQSQDARA